MTSFQQNSSIKNFRKQNLQKFSVAIKTIRIYLKKRTLKHFKERMNQISQMKTPSLTLVIPFFNREQYLPFLFSTLLPQAESFHEIIVVDDASTDSSAEIIRSFHRALPIELLSLPEHSGPAEARNAGLAKATGDYIAFLDSDDFTAPDLYAHLLKTAKQTSADLVQCGYYYFYEAEKSLIPRCSKWAKTDHATLRTFPELLFLDNVIWNKIYRRSMLERYGIRFDSSIKMAEDLPFFFTTLMAAEKIVITDRPLYYYRKGRPGQLTAQKNRNRFAVFQAFDNTNEFVDRHHFEYIKPYLLHSALSLFAYMYEPLEEEFKEEFFCRMRDYFLRNRVSEKEHIPSGPWKNASFSDKMRWLILRRMHPLALHAILNNDRKAYDRLIALRSFLQDLPRKFSRIRCKKNSVN